jgi:hypothetical protein
MNTKHKNYIELANKGIKNSEICKKLCIADSTGYQIRRKYKDQIGLTKLTETNVDIRRYDDDLTKGLKTIILKITDILQTKNLQKESSPQLLKALGIAFDKLRLHEGKSTSNIAHKHVNEMSTEEKEVLRELANEYKKKLFK